MECPSYEDLLASWLGEGPAEAAHHAVGCRTCGRRLAVIDRMMAGLAPGLLPDVPEALAASAAALGRLEPAPVTIERGRIVLDTASAEPLVGLRGSPLAERHLLVEAGPFEVDLAHRASGAVAGHVVGPEDARASLSTCLLTGEAGSQATPIEVHGDFWFARVPPGSYTLVLVGEDRHVVVDDVPLHG